MTPLAEAVSASGRRPPFRQRKRNCCCQFILKFPVLTRPGSSARLSRPSQSPSKPVHPRKSAPTEPAPFERARFLFFQIPTLAGRMGSMHVGRAFALCKVPPCGGFMGRLPSVITMSPLGQPKPSYRRQYNRRARLRCISAECAFTPPPDGEQPGLPASWRRAPPRRRACRAGACPRTRPAPASPGRP